MCLIFGTGWSNETAIDDDIAQEAKRSADAILEASETLAMWRNERGDRAVKTFKVAEKQVFFMTLKCFVTVTVFLNHSRDFVVEASAKLILNGPGDFERSE